jgi:DnaJ-class molecular chaperone
MNYTYYDYLELSPGAPCERIEAAYARVLQRFNDGESGGQDLSGLVRMIHAAHDVLANPDARRAYDLQLQREAAAADEELKAALDAKAKVLPRRVQDVPRPLSFAFSALAA